MELTSEEKATLNGEHGDTLQTAYRILVATGEATNAEKLIPITWAHLSGVNYNTIGDAGEQFLRELSKDARVKVKSTVNPMGIDFDHISEFNHIDDEFIKKQASIRDSYIRMGVEPTFSCTPYDIFDLPEKNTQVSFAESNAAIFANSLGGLKTNKESAFSALASAITGKSPYSDLRKDDISTSITIRMKMDNPNELDFGMLGFFAGKVGDTSVNISGVSQPNRRSCKALCGGMGTSGTCAKFQFVDTEDNTSEKVDFGKEEMNQVFDELNTAEKGDIITLGSPQLGLEELSDLSKMLKGKSFEKRCLIFCSRAVQEQARTLDYINEIERAGGEILSDCCICLTPLIDTNETDAVTTNSIKGAYYLKNSTGVDVNLKSLSKIIEDETK
ncbi:MAG: aconitase X catalytic domain-containing protein [Crenarchaeota archaeon]|nr:aconitase X catalytic domain-containing protein [Thermoproteota archaeon]